MISILSLFSGIGAFESALDRIGCLYQLYKQAGNSIVVNVLAEIFNKLLTEEEKHVLAGMQRETENHQKT